MQIHKEIFLYKILYSFIKTDFLTNENPYGRALSLRRDTNKVWEHKCVIHIQEGFFVQIMPDFI